MNKKEQSTIEVVANDVRWIRRQREEDAQFIQRSLDKIATHLITLNNNVAENTSFRKWVKPLVIAGVVAIILRVIGVY